MAGFEGADSGGNVVVARSFFRDNRVGVLLVSAGKEGRFHQQDTTVVGNVIANNANSPPPAAATTSASACSCAAGAATGWRATASPAIPGPVSC